MIRHDLLALALFIVLSEAVVAGEPTYWWVTLYDRTR
jgi:hypothetical protein